MKNIEVFFTRPGSACAIEDEIIKDINNSNSKILMAAAFTSDSSKIIQAINNKKDEHIKIVVNTRNFTPNFNTPYVGEIKLEEGCMHNKFIIIDNSILWTGSFNWTVNAAQANFENALRITDPEIIKEYVTEFHRMYFLSNVVKEDGLSLSKEGKSFITKCTNCNHNITDVGTDFNVEVQYYHQHEHISVKNNSFQFSDMNDDTNIDKKMIDDKGNEFTMTKARFLTYLGDNSEFINVVKEYAWYCVKCKIGKELKGHCTECNKSYDESDLIEVNEYDRVKYFSKSLGEVHVIEDYRLRHEHSQYSNGLYYKKICLSCIDDFFSKSF